MLEKVYRPKEVEEKIYSRWEASGAFACGRQAGGDPYTIVIPPPNVTGSLHLGHALNNTLQDILVRSQRMRGRDVLWQPGMDHAGIATQMLYLGSGNSLEDLVKEMVRPMLKEWLDQNLPALVKHLVRKEIQRMVNRAEDI